MSTEKQNAIKLFDYQIAKEINRNERNGKSEITNSWFHREAFIQTVDLTPLDWREIRSGKYWAIHDTITRKGLRDEISKQEAEKEKLKHLLHAIKEWRKSKRRS